MIQLVYTLLSEKENNYYMTIEEQSDKTESDLYESDSIYVGIRCNPEICIGSSKVQVYLRGSNVSKDHISFAIPKEHAEIIFKTLNKCTKFRNNLS